MGLSNNDRINAMKSKMEKIPICNSIDIEFGAGSLRMDLHALVASSKYTGYAEADLIYVEAGSQGGQLTLRRIPNGKELQDEPERYAKGLCDQDPTTGTITAVYLDKEDVMPESFQGTLDDLFSHPNIYRK